MEALPTLSTHKGFFSGVDSLVSVGVSTSHVGNTHVGLLVLGERSEITEAFSTLPAFERSLASVGSLVISKVTFSAEAVPTFKTRVGPFSCVHSSVGDKVGAHPEVFPTLTAYEGLLTWVGSPVFN